MSNIPTLEKFIGTGFDFEYLENRQWEIFECTKSLIQNYSCRPRLNKPQVLDDYSFIENFEGFVWEIRKVYPNEGVIYSEIISDENILDFSGQILFIDGDESGFTPASVSFVGIMQGSRFEAWSRANDIPIINENGEVVV